MVPIRGGVAAARSSSSAGAAAAAALPPPLPLRRRRISHPSCARAASVASSEPPSTSSDGNGSGNGNGTITDDPNFRCNGLQVDRNKEIYGSEREVSVATLAVHGGEREGRPRVSDSLTTPIVQVRDCKEGSKRELFTIWAGSRALEEGETEGGGSEFDN